MNGHSSNGAAQGQPPYGQPQWNQQWNTSPNPQHPGQGTSYPPPPTSQASQPYPSAPTNGYPAPSANGYYPPPTSQAYPQQHPQMGTTLPPISQEPRPDMMQHRYPYPQQPHPYGHGGPPGGPPPPHAHMAYQQPPQPAPRQRTAIACRYCRRRKIRCSGFESSDDGRCTNCVRFAQECIFTPVSAQTQAFVPAHTVNRWGNGQPPALYGAYGQPLPPSHVSQQPPAPQGQHAQGGYPLPSPTGPYPSPGATYSPGGTAYDDRSIGDVTVSRKRLHPEHHSPTLPPPNPAVAASLNYSEHRSNYPEPTSLMPATSPGSSHASYPHSGGPYYTNPAPPQPQPPRRSSPQSNYSYDTNRTSSSPHASNAPSTPNSSVYPPFPGGQLQPIRGDGRTPPPPTSQPPQQNGTNGTDAKNGSANGRPSMRITDLVSDGNGRSSTDSDMLNALNRQRKS